MNKQPRIRIIFSATIAILLSGCATSFNSGVLEPVAQFPQTTAPKSVYIDLAFTGTYNGESWPTADLQNSAYLKQLCGRRIQESGMFGAVVNDKTQADLLVYIAVINARTVDEDRQLLSAATLSIVPFKSYDTFHLQAVIRDAHTGQQKIVKLKNGIIHNQQMLLGLLAPFYSSNRAMAECRESLFDHLLLEIHQSGLLN